MATEFKLPELGEGVESADVARIHVSEGDQIQAEQNVMELETEKAVADLPCPHAGKITKIHVSEGDTIQVGQTLVTIDEVEAAEKEQPAEGREDAEAGTTTQDEPDSAEDAESPEKEERREAEKKPGEAAHGTETSREPSSPGDGKRLPPAAGPATRRLARKLGIDLDQFQPPDGGRIRPEDVVTVYVESGKAAMLTSPSLPDFSQFGPTRREPLSKIAQTAARRLTGSWRTVPQVTQHGMADITALEAARRQHVERADGSAPKITLTSIAIKSVVGLLKEFPKFNSSLDYGSQELILKSYYHIGVAVDTDHGLLVPVIRDVNRKSIAQIAAELTGLADNARGRKLGKGDFEGATFTISNQGAIGGGEFTPLVNFPEVAILGMARARPELRMVDGQPEERLILPLSLSYDHRIINGADAARFIDRLTKILADEFTLLITT